MSDVTQNTQALPSATSASLSPERLEEIRTDYILAGCVDRAAEWIMSHALPGEVSQKVHLATLARAASILRGAPADAPHSLDDMLRNDAWAAAIASHVQIPLLDENRRLRANLDASTRRVLELEEEKAKALGFTHKDVALLRDLISELPATAYDAGEDERLYRIANKINALLPPSAPQET